MSSSTLVPPVRRVALVPRRGEMNPALCLGYDGPLTTLQRSMVMTEVAQFMVLTDQSYETEFPKGNIVLLQPAADQGQRDEEDYRALARHLGCEAPNDLPIIGLEQEGDSDEIISIVAHETGLVH